MMFLGRRPSSLLVFAAFIAISECNPISQRDVTHSTLQEYGVKVYKKSEPTCDAINAGQRYSFILGTDTKTGNPVTFKGNPPYDIIQGSDSASPFFTLQVDQSPSYPLQFCPFELNDESFGYGEICNGVYNMRRSMCRNIGLGVWSADCPQAGSGSGVLNLHAMPIDPSAAAELYCVVSVNEIVGNIIPGIICGEDAVRVRGCVDAMLESDGLGGRIVKAELRLEPL